MGFPEFPHEEAQYLRYADDIYTAYKERRLMDDYSGFHNRREPDHNGWDHFEVYHRDSKWYWRACDTNSEHVGFEHGPFGSSLEAFQDA